jgi:glucan phosphoethanolaminetransferase (alkaline phosphatase superfamily)
MPSAKFVLMAPGEGIVMRNSTDCSSRADECCRLAKLAAKPEVRDVLRSELLSLLLVILAGVSYSLSLHVLTVVFVPSPNHWWLRQWSFPIALGTSVGVFFIASLWRWAFFVLVNLSLCLAGLAGYFIGAKSIILNSNVFAALVEATPAEASEFVAAKLLVTVLLTAVLGVSVTIPYLCCNQFNFLGCLSRVTLAALIFIVVGVTVPHPLEASADVFLPADFGSRAYDYYLHRKALEEAVRNRFDIASLPSSIDSKTGEDFTLVLVVGESARADHLSLNGYSRDTNPFTRGQTGLVNFKDVISCGVFTAVSVPCLFTRATIPNRATFVGNREELLPRETSLLNLAKKHGFHITWISMNDAYGQNVSISAIADTADEKIFRFGNAVPGGFKAGVDIGGKKDPYGNLSEINDSYLLPYFHNTVRKYEAGRQLIVVHLRGSHTLYYYRYPANFAAFKPDSCAKDECRINAYDNSIRLTDYMLSRFIEDLSDREALLFYVSDHGESLGETDERGQVYHVHGNPQRIEQRIVPMQVWASDRFIAKFPDRLATLRSRAMIPLSHDHFFHSVLDCVGIHSDVVDNHLSLCTQGEFIERDKFFAISSGE